MKEPTNDIPNSSSRLTFFQYQPTDWRALQRMVRDSFTLAFGDQNAPENMAAYARKAFGAEQIRAELAHPESWFYGLRVNGQTAGYFKLNRGAAQTEPIADGLEIERIYLLPPFYRQGYGQRLMDEIFRLAPRWQPRVIWLGVWDQNRTALRFYERNGFEPFGEHDFWMGTDRQRDILLQKIWRPEMEKERV